MGILDWLIACIPIFSFGLVPVISTQIGGKPVEQSMGVSLGSLVFAIVLFFIHRPALSQSTMIIGMLSGLCWSIGSIGQFMGLTYLGVSRSMPISCVGQITGTSILGVLLGDWSTSMSRIFGFSALALIIIGTVFTSYHSGNTGPKPEWKKGILINLLSALGFTFYVGILRYYNISGWDSILPQSVGQVTSILLISLLFFKRHPFSFATAKNSSSGIVWATGNIALLLSQVKLGLSVAYPVSQAAIIVSVLGGVFINKEKKNKTEWLYTLIGMGIIVGGLVLIYFSSVYD